MERCGSGPHFQASAFYAWHMPGIFFIFTRLNASEASVSASRDAAARWRQFRDRETREAGGQISA
jgi:hypothetical protein